MRWFAIGVLATVAPYITLWGLPSALGSGTSSPVSAGTPAFDRTEVATIDLVVIFGYLVGIVLLGSYAGLRRKKTTVTDYFLANRSLTWPVIGMALFATNISTIHLVSFAQNGYTSGMTYGNYEWMAAFTLVVLSLFFAPFYLRAQVATLPDFMEKRYGRACRDYLAILSIFSAIVVHIGFSLLTGAIVLEGTILHLFVDQPERFRALTVLAICGATAIYTIIGGLLAVVVTEAIQTVVLLLGSVLITVIGFHMIGGWEGLRSAVHPINLTIVRPASDPTGVTWYAVFLGYPVLGIWYWCTDQTIVQRVLGAKDEHHARLGPLFAGFIKILPVYLFVLPGIICLGLVQQGKIPPLPLTAEGLPNTEQTYTHLIKTILWPGMRGVVIAAMLAALMSTVSGSLNSIATLFSYDIYSRFRPQADDRHLVRVGRIATFVAMCVAVAWTLSIHPESTVIFQAMVDVFPVVAPPTATVFIWGVFWRRTSARAALAILVGGSIVGLVIFVLTRMGLIPINSLFMAFLLFVAESVVIVLLSFVWPHQHTPESNQLVWKNPLEALRADRSYRGMLDFRVVAVALVATMIGLYWWFSSAVSFHPLMAQIVVDGKPGAGLLAFLDAPDDRFDTVLLTNEKGEVHYGSKFRAGGLPPGMAVRLSLCPVSALSNVDWHSNFVIQEEALKSKPPGTGVIDPSEGRAEPNKAPTQSLNPGATRTESGSSLHSDSASFGSALDRFLSHPQVQKGLRLLGRPQGQNPETHSIPAKFCDPENTPLKLKAGPAPTRYKVIINGEDFAITLAE
ncbi:MAG: sodium:solute symporter [Thermoguttaceae bacterium]|nr:sodium:solute symporter [Thermoguttaceae bacterium]MDW8077694.1 sodium:solute symporter [Thermoguttaceae bacterium]